MGTPQRSRYRREQSGVALILVLCVLAALVMIGTPFVVSMRLQEKGSQVEVANYKAALLSRSVRNHAIAELYHTCPSREPDERLSSDLPEEHRPWARRIDSHEEIVTTPFRDLEFQSFGDHDRPPSLAPSLQGLKVEVEQGKVDVNSAPATLLGQLLGGSLLSEDVTAVDSFRIPVEETSRFATDNDPETVDGVVAILDPISGQFEAVSYRHTTSTHLLGCGRGEYLSLPRSHRVGSPVFDIRALKIAEVRDRRSPARAFRRRAEVRSISDVSLVKIVLTHQQLLGRPILARRLSRAGREWQLLLEEIDTESRREEVRQVFPPKNARRKRRSQRSRRDAEPRATNAFDPVSARQRWCKAAGSSFAAQLERIAGTNGLWYVQDDLDDADGLARVSAVMKEVSRTQRAVDRHFRRALRSYEELRELPGLETFFSTDYRKLESLITVHARRPRAWTTEQILLGNIPAMRTVSGFPLRVTQRGQVRPGTLVRIRGRDSGLVEYRRVVRPERDAPNFSVPVIWLDRPLRHTYELGEARIAARVRHPIDVNSASPEILRAALIGLSSDPEGTHRVRVDEAERLAQRLIDARPIHGFAHLVSLVRGAAQAGAIDPEDVSPILCNAQNPNDPRLVIASTGFCYSGSDVYSMEVYGSILDESRRERAASSFREVVDVSPPGPQWIRIRGQEDLASRNYPIASRNWPPEFPLTVGDRAARFMITGPSPLHRAPFQLPETLQGSLKARSRELTAGISTWGPIHHFRDTVEGLRTARLSFPISTVNGEDQDLLRQPGMIEFWIQPRTWRSGRRIIIAESWHDSSEGERNGLRLFYDRENTELVFQLFDETPSFEPGSSGVAAAEVRHRISLNAYVWYHIAAVWNSTQPGDQALLVDHRVVGRNQRWARLEQPLSRPSTVLHLPSNRVEEWPVRGALQIGQEVADYRRRGGTFHLTRGARGTHRDAHPRGTPVRLFGYVVDLVPVGTPAPVVVPPHNRVRLDDTLIVGEGGARIPNALQPPLALVDIPSHGFRVATGTSKAIDSPYPAIRGPETPAPLANAVALDHDPVKHGFPKRGYAQLVACTGEEIFSYDGIRKANGSWVLTGLRRGRMNSEPPAVPLFFDPGIIVRSISIEASGGGLRKRYNSAGVIQLGSGEGAEWVRYDSIEDDQFFVRRPGSLEFRRYANLRGPQGVRIPGPTRTTSASSEVLQVLRSSHPHVGAGDRVQLCRGVDGGDPLQRESLQIDTARITDTGTLFAFRDPPSRPYTLDAQPQVKRFPSGERIRYSSGEIIFSPRSDLDVVIDEIRLTSLGNPGSVSPVPARNVGVAPRISAADGVQAGQRLDKLLMVGLSRVDLVEGFWVRRTADPSQFAHGQSEGLLLHGEEIFHYELLDHHAGTVPARLAIELPGPAASESTVPRIPIIGNRRWPTEGGFIELVDGGVREVIAYQSFRNGSLWKCTRGAFNTSICRHPRNTTAVLLPHASLDLHARGLLDSERQHSELGRGFALPLPHLPVTSATSHLQGHVVAARSVEAFPTDGYLIADAGDSRVVDEIFYYQERLREPDPMFVRPRDDRGGQTIFRQRFGTNRAASPQRGVSLIELPMRYGDRYQSQVDSRQLAFWERSFVAPGAHWKRLRWELNCDSPPITETMIRALVRFDGQPEWDAEITQEPGGLYLFTEPDGENRIDISAHRMEVRLIPWYPPGARGRTRHGRWSDAWKLSPIIEKVEIELERSTQTLSHEAVRW